jgi:hypothetical protein
VTDPYQLGQREAIRRLSHLSDVRLPRSFAPLGREYACSLELRPVEGCGQRVSQLHRRKGPEARSRFGGYPLQCRLWAQGLTATLAREANHFKQGELKNGPTAPRMRPLGWAVLFLYSRVRAREGVSVVWVEAGPVRDPRRDTNSRGYPSPADHAHGLEIGATLMRRANPFKQAA